MRDAEIEQRFATQAEAVMPQGRHQALLRALWHADEAPNVIAALDLVRVGP